MHATIDRPDAYIAMFQMLQDIEPAPGCSLPRSVHGTVSSVIDRLRSGKAPSEQIGIAEQVAVAAHRLEWAVRARDVDADVALRRELRTLFSRWLDAAVPIN